MFDWINGTACPNYIGDSKVPYEDNSIVWNWKLAASDNGSMGKMNNMIILLKNTATGSNLLKSVSLKLKPDNSLNWSLKYLVLE